MSIVGIIYGTVGQVTTVSRKRTDPAGLRQQAYEIDGLLSQHKVDENLQRIQQAEEAHPRQGVRGSDQNSNHTFDIRI